VAGISIGAINAALTLQFAGNAVEKLREFWRTITTSAIWPVRISDLVNGAGLPFDLGKQISAMHALLFGPVELLRTAKACRLVVRPHRDQLLRHELAEIHIGAACRFRPH